MDKTRFEKAQYFTAKIVSYAACDLCLKSKPSLGSLRFESELRAWEHDGPRRVGSYQLIVSSVGA